MAAMVASTTSATYVKSRDWSPKPSSGKARPPPKASNTRAKAMSGRWRGPYTEK